MYKTRKYFNGAINTSLLDLANEVFEILGESTFPMLPGKVEFEIERATAVSDALTLMCEGINYLQVMELP